MKRVRTLHQAHEEIKAADPDTAISFTYIRKCVVDGKCPATRSGRKWLVDVDELLKFISEEMSKNHVEGAR